ncbi:DNA mismatch repair protein MutT [Pedobacter psychrophilus]|uniref:DNA mismatch repair protein MutT n=1 Tax=Pedobacter psychrophilus TaxID=1826909 RepID=A0A179DE52_9SPHI|nr:metallophosphoesterase [Pedobacter psychrophilus]OAQ39248.1 DNA mismatch repair protein MutT [Pedobacter psychrophilus]
MGRIIPLLIISVLLLLIDFYSYKAILHTYQNWSNAVKKSFRAIWWGYTAVLLIGVYTTMIFNLDLGIRTIFLVAFFITFVSKLFFMPFLFIDDIRRLFIIIKNKISGNKEIVNAENSIPRSEFLVKAGLVVAAIPLASLSYGITCSYDYRIRKQKIYFKNLPSEFDGIKLGQISDIHSGSFYNKKAVLGGIEMLMGQKPDLIFFTGDLVNGVASEMRDYQDLFSKVKAPLGVFSTLGNHDYGMYEKWPTEAARVKNIEAIKKTHQLMGWDLLMNENRRLKVNGAEIGILGIENWGTGRFPKHGKMEEAIKNTDDLPVKLLLSHDPSHWRAEVLQKYPTIDMSFAGHTHGAQFGIESEYVKWSPVQYVYDEWDGLYKNGNQQLYVNVGFGFIGYPGRVGILPEITIFELKKG